jgi:hypothetical protein
MSMKSAIIIDAIIVDPPSISPGETARIIIHARSPEGGPLDFEVSASEGVIEPTDEPNVFLWHVPETEAAAEEAREELRLRREHQPPGRHRRRRGTLTH